MGSVSRDTGPCPDIDCSCGCNTNSSGEPLNFKANSPSPPLSVLSQAINTGRPSTANTSIWNNGLPPIVTDQEDIQMAWNRMGKWFKKNQEGEVKTYTLLIFNNNTIVGLEAETSNSSINVKILNWNNFCKIKQ